MANENEAQAKLLNLAKGMDKLHGQIKEACKTADEVGSSQLSLDFVELYNAVLPLKAELASALLRSKQMRTALEKALPES